jgi:hypothetical protein
MTTVDLAKRLNLAQPTASQAVMRGQKIAEDQGLCLLKNLTNNSMDVIKNSCGNPQPRIKVIPH